MLERSAAYSGFSVDDIVVAKRFYGETLGLSVTESNGMLSLVTAGDRTTLIYPKGEAHVPATYTIMNFPVGDIDSVVDELTAKGIEMTRYPGLPQDGKGIMRGRAAGQGPDIAWFTDPAGNVLSVLQDD